MDEASSHNSQLSAKDRARAFSASAAARIACAPAGFNMCGAHRLRLHNRQQLLRFKRQHMMVGANNADEAHFRILTYVQAERRCHQTKSS